MQEANWLPHPGLPAFDYIRPAGPADVSRLLLAHGAEARLLMGGTDLLVRIRDGKVRPHLVIDVKHLPGLREVHDGAGLTIGAAVTMNAVARYPAVRAHYGVLAQAVESVASYQLRNRATLGGNLANASPAADTAPAVLVLEGALVLAGPHGERTVPAGAFFLGPGQSCLQPGEFLTAVHLPLPPERAVGVYVKLGRNQAGDLALAGVAVLGFPDATAASGCRFRIALASVAPVPLRVTGAEQVLAAAPPGDDAFAQAAEEAMRACRPIDDVRASADYRRAMVRNLTLRALREVWGRMEVGG